MAGRFWQPYIRQAVGKQLDFAGADWLYRTGGCFPIGDEPMAEEKR
jgi:hypothetical protein